MLTVTRLDRLARSTRDLLNTLAAITDKEGRFPFPCDAWADTTTPHGRLMLTVLGGLAEFERELIRARTGEGRARAKANGKSLGRPHKLTPHQRREAINAVTMATIGARDRPQLQRAPRDDFTAGGMTDPVSTGFVALLSALLKTLSPWIFGALALAGLAILYAPAFGGIDPSGFRKESGASIWVGTILCAILCVVLAVANLMTRYAARRVTRNERVEGFIVLAKTVHDRLLSWGALDATYLDGCLNRIDQSEDAVWIDDDVRDTRNVFIDHAKRALEVRRTRDDYRNPIERSETKEYLDNSKDRLIAALLKRKLPEFFDPYHEDTPSWWQRLWRRRMAPNPEFVLPEAAVTPNTPLQRYSATDRARLDDALYKMFDLITTIAIPAQRAAEHNLLHNWETKMLSPGQGPKYFVNEIDRIRAEAGKCQTILHRMIYAEYNYYRDELREAVLEGKEIEFFLSLDHFRQVAMALPPTASSAAQLRLLVEDNHNRLAQGVAEYAYWIRDARERIKQKRDELQSLQ